MPSISAGGPPPPSSYRARFSIPQGWVHKTGTTVLMHRAIEIENNSMFTFRKLIWLIKKKIMLVLHWLFVCKFIKSKEHDDSNLTGMT